MYAALKHLHVACVALSLTGFVLRYALAARGVAAARGRFARTTPHLIDTVLLGAGIGMLAAGSLDPLDHPWLLAKFAGLGAYIAFGTFALRRARTATGRKAAFVGALTSFAYVAGAAAYKSAWSFLAALA